MKLGKHIHILCFGEMTNANGDVLGRRSAIWHINAMSTDILKKSTFS